MSSITEGRGWLTWYLNDPKHWHCSFDIINMLEAVTLERKWLTSVIVWNGYSVDLASCAAGCKSQQQILYLRTDGRNVICLLIYLCISLCIDLIISWKIRVLNYWGVSRCCGVNYAEANLPWLLCSKVRMSFHVRLGERSNEGSRRLREDSLPARLCSHGKASSPLPASLTHSLTHKGSHTPHTSLKDSEWSVTASLESLEWLSYFWK